MTDALQPTKRAQAQYSNEFIGSALALLKANRGNVSGTAKQLNIPRPTLREWAMNHRRDSPEVRETQHLKEGTLDQKFEQIAHLYADRLTDPEMVLKATPHVAAVVSGIAVDKRQLLNGMPTSITSAVMSDNEKRLRLAEIIAGIAARNPQPAPQQSPQSEPLDIALLHG